MPFQGIPGLQPQLTPGQSQYLNSVGAAYGLPRPDADFRDGQFGPGRPIEPVPIDVPDEIAGLPMPRRSQFPVGYNLPIGIPGSEGLKLVSFAVMRAYAEGNSFVRACITARKSEMLGMEYDIVPTPDAEKAMRADRQAHADFQERRKHALAWWARPDPDYDDFQSWFSACLESILVDDALALYLHPTRVPGKGAFGTDLAALEWIDGSSIRPVIGMRGQRPRPPAPAYQQYLWGVPRADLTAVLHEADIEAMAEAHDQTSDDIEPVKQYRRDQLMYLRQEVRGWTPYGLSPVEKCIIPIITLLKRQELGLSFFSEGSIPAAFVMIGGEMNATTQQAKVWQETLNALAGDVGYKQQLTVLPQGSSVSPMREQPFDHQLLRSIQEDIMMNFLVQPQDLSMAPGGHSSGLGGKGAAEGAENMAQKRDKPEVLWLTRTIFNFVIQSVWGQTDMQWRFGGMEPVEDSLKKAQTHKIYVDSGIQTRDEVREELKKQPFGMPGTSDPSVMTTQGIMSLGGLGPEDVAAEDDNRPEPGIDVESQEALNAQADRPETESPLHAGSDSQAVDESVDEAQAATSDAAKAVGLEAEPELNHNLYRAAVRYKVTKLHGEAETELKTLRQFLKNGRSISKFRAKVLSPAAMDTATKAAGISPSAAVRAARKVVYAELWKIRKSAILTKLHEPLHQKIASHASALKAGKSSQSSFVASSSAALSTSYTDAFMAGANDYNPDYELTDANQTALDARVGAQSDFLTEWSSVLSLGMPNVDDPSLTPDAESDAATTDRASMYADSIQPVYDMGVTSAVIDDQGAEGVIITWLGGDCPLCAERDGEEITPDDDGTLSWSNGEGFPGDGDFGDLCEGGPRCNCDLSYSGSDGTSLFDHSGGDPGSKVAKVTKNVTLPQVDTITRGEFAEGMKSISATIAAGFQTPVIPEGAIKVDVHVAPSPAPEVHVINQPAPIEAKPKKDRTVRKTKFVTDASGAITGKIEEIVSED